MTRFSAGQGGRLGGASSLEEMRAELEGLRLDTRERRQLEELKSLLTGLERQFKAIETQEGESQTPSEPGKTQSRKETKEPANKPSTAQPTGNDAP